MTAATTGGAALLVMRAFESAALLLPMIEPLTVAAAAEATDAAPVTAAAATATTAAGMHAFIKLPLLESCWVSLKLDASLASAKRQNSPDVFGETGANRGRGDCDVWPFDGRYARLFVIDEPALIAPTLLGSRGQIPL
jgi:hypothetical protein